MLFSEEVLRRAYAVEEQLFDQWAICHSMGDRLEDIPKQVIEALKICDGEIYQTARYLEDVYDWHPNYTLLHMLDAVAARLEQKIDTVTLESVLRTKIRFPGRPGDLIVFRDRWTYLRTARIKFVKNSSASAEVEYEDNNKLDIVFAEDVVENKTTGEGTTLARKPVTLTKAKAPK